MKPSDLSATEARHNPAEHRFEITVEGRLAVADYTVNHETGQFVMIHTFVPPELRGKGLAEKVVRAALDYARHQGLKVVPACSYVQVFIERNQEYKSLLA